MGRNRTSIEAGLNQLIPNWIHAHLLAPILVLSTATKYSNK